MQFQDQKKSLEFKALFTVEKPLIDWLENLAPWGTPTRVDTHIRKNWASLPTRWAIYRPAELTDGELCGVCILRKPHKGGQDWKIVVIPRPIGEQWRMPCRSCYEVLHSLSVVIDAAPCLAQDIYGECRMCNVDYTMQRLTLA